MSTLYGTSDIIGALKLSDGVAPFRKITGESDDTIYFVPGFVGPFDGERFQILADHIETLTYKTKGGKLPNMVFAGWSGLGDFDPAACQGGNILRDCTMEKWLNHQRQIFARHATGKVVIIGSSFGAIASAFLASENKDATKGVVWVGGVTTTQDIIDLYFERSPKSRESFTQRQRFHFPASRKTAAGPVYLEITETLVKEAEAYDLLKQAETLKFCGKMTAYHDPADPVAPIASVRRFMNKFSSAQAELVEVPCARHEHIRPEDHWRVAGEAHRMLYAREYI